MCFFCSSGFLFIQHPGLMFVPDVKTLYNGLLSDRKKSVNLKIQVLKNLQTYLQEEDSRMQEADRECECLSHTTEFSFSLVSYVFNITVLFLYREEAF